MEIMMMILSYELKLLWRNSILRILIAVMFTIGIYAIYSGKSEIQEQKARIDSVQLYERQRFDSLLYWAQLDTTLSSNKKKYLKAVTPTGADFEPHFTYYFVNQIHPLSALSLGQMDLFPGYYGFNVGDLTRQLNVNELTNPMELLTGNFDLAYVFIFLVPLLIIALFYNLYSSEKESGTLLLLRSQPVHIGKIILFKGTLRFIVVLLLSSILLLTACIVLRISIVKHYEQLLLWLSVTSIYALGWVIMMGLVVALKKSSSSTAILGLSLWMILTLINPSILNLLAEAKKPLPNRAEVIDVIRELNDEFWESPKSLVLDQFYKNHPNYANEDTLDFDKWYYATFVLLDEQASIRNAQMDVVSQERDIYLKRWSWLCPTALVHDRLSNICGTGVRYQNEFRASMMRFHQTLKEIYYSRIYSGMHFTQRDLRKLESLL